MKTLTFAAISLILAGCGSSSVTQQTSTVSTPVKNLTAIDSRLSDADIFYKQKNYTEAIQIWRSLAESGNAEAQYRLGVDAKDPAQAVSWYLKAAKRGNAAAQYQLGEAYIMGGGGLTRDRAAGIKWITLAAKQGDPNAIISLNEIARSAQASAQYEAQHSTTTLTGHYRADGLMVYDRTDAVATLPVSHSQSDNPQCSQLIGMLDTASSNARRVIMQNLNARGCSIPQEAVQHVAHPAYDQCVAVLQQAGATTTSRCDHLYNR